MKLWNKKKGVDRELPSFVRSGLVKFNQKLITSSGFLQRTTNRYSTRKKKVLLILFIIVFVTESSIVIVQSVKGTHKTSLVVTKIKTIPIQKEEQTPIITKEEFLKIQRFKTCIHSLSTTAKGRRRKDSLLQNRPHLMDSVNLLITLYLEQSKTK